MKSDLVKLSKRIGKHEIRLIIFEDRVSVYFDFPIAKKACKMSDQHKENIILHLEEKGLALDQERGLIVKSGVSCDKVVALLAYVEALLAVFNDEFFGNIGADNFIGRVELESRKIRAKLTHSILGQSTAIIHLKKTGYAQIENGGERKEKGEKISNFFKKIGSGL